MSDADTVPDNDAKQNMLWLLQNANLSVTAILSLTQRLRALKLKNLVTAHSLRVVNGMYQRTRNPTSFVQSNRGRPVTMRLIRDIYQIITGKDRSKLATQGMGVFKKRFSPRSSLAHR